MEDIFLLGDIGVHSNQILDVPLIAHIEEQYRDNLLSPVKERWLSIENDRNRKSLDRFKGSTVKKFVQYLKKEKMKLSKKMMYDYLIRIALEDHEKHRYAETENILCPEWQMSIYTITPFEKLDKVSEVMLELDQTSSVRDLNDHVTKCLNRIMRILSRPANICLAYRIDGSWEYTGEGCMNLSGPGSFGLGDFASSYLSHIKEREDDSCSLWFSTTEDIARRYARTLNVRFVCQYMKIKTPQYRNGVYEVDVKCINTETGYEYRPHVEPKDGWAFACHIGIENDLIKKIIANA